MKKLLLTAPLLVGLLAVGARGASATGPARSRPALERCGVGLAGTSYLLRLTGPHVHAQCAQKVKQGKPLGAFWSTSSGRGLVLVCQARYPDGVLHQIYAASRDDFYASMGCSLVRDDQRTWHAKRG